VPDENLLKRYADLVVRVGANVREGQDVAVFAYVEQAPFVRALAAAAYEVGARYVTAQYADQYVKRETIIHVSDDVLEWSPPWELERLEYFARVGGATISVAGDPNPDVFADLDGVRVGKARPKQLAERSLQITFEEKSINWTIAAYPNENWATKIFGTPDVDRLWDEVAKAVRLDEADPVAAWRAHVEKLRSRAALLTERRFDALRFTGPGTDLTIGLTPAFNWGAGTLETAGGTVHVPNMPTEEVFTEPDARRTEGTVRSTRPLATSGGIIVEGLQVRFEGGRVVEAKADKGQEVIESQLDSDEGARRLGEGRARRRLLPRRPLGRDVLRHVVRRERDLSHRLRQRPELHAQPGRAAARGSGEHLEHPHRLHDRRPRGAGGRPRARRHGGGHHPRRRVGARLTAL